MRGPKRPVSEPRLPALAVRLAAPLIQSIDMTGPEFWLDVPSNTIATIIGVGIGIPVGFWFEHRIERQREYKSNVGRLESLRGVIFVLRESLDANLSAIELCEREVGSSRIIYEPGLELFTWEAIKPQVVEFLGNPEFIARIARFFSPKGVRIDACSSQTDWERGASRSHRQH